MFRALLRRLSKLLLWLAALSVLLVLALRWVPPPFTALMVERKLESWSSGESIDLQRTWRPWKTLPDDLKMAVIAAEDQKFADHWGFDIAAIRAAFAHNERGGSLRGASTLSQQVAKNLFLWSGRSWVRKGLEVWFTGWIELLWPKQRILEVYLNSVEWGNGIFGAQAAAQHHFAVGAPYLSAAQASQLAAVLPNPREWNAGRPGPHVRQRAAWIRQQVRQLGGSHYLNRMRESEARRN
jgi:monofunctional biosynthetic peptidoglycan transglycosylase